MSMVYLLPFLIQVVFSTLIKPVIIDGNPVVESPAGKFKGRTIKSRNGRDIYTFEGIPYAKPPVGELRFKDPVDTEKLDGLYLATDDSRECFQPLYDFTQLKNISAFRGQEDCLYLNVYIPMVNESSESLPVFVWIHGGVFYLGSGSTKLNGPQYLLDKDMILVAINYRLGMLGFLSSGDPIIPGNFGLKDQVKALEWVRENIQYFGGDPHSVTIGGESAGGVSVSLLIHSVNNKGLFHRAIAQSGTAYSSYAVRSWAVAAEEAKRVATELGCSYQSKQFLRCLQKMPVETLFEAGATINPPVIGAVDFVPVLEETWPGAFLTKDSWKQEVNRDLPMMVGINSREAMYFVQGFLAQYPKYSKKLDAFKDDLANILPTWGGYLRNPNKDEITQGLFQFYFGDEGVTNATEVQITDMLGDLMVNHGTHIVAKQDNGPTFLYMLSYVGHKNMPIQPPRGAEDGVAHSEDLIYLFKSDWFPNKEWTKEDLAMSRTIVDMWYNFIKNGKPTGDGSWSESEGGTKYLDITNKGLVMKTNMFQQRMQFLDQLNIDRTL